MRKDEEGRRGRRKEKGTRRKEKDEGRSKKEANVVDDECVDEADDDYDGDE